MTATRSRRRGGQFVPLFWGSARWLVSRGAESALTIDGLDPLFAITKHRSTGSFCVHCCLGTILRVASGWLIRNTLYDQFYYLKLWEEIYAESSRKCFIIYLFWNKRCTRKKCIILIYSSKFWNFNTSDLNKIIVQIHNDVAQSSQRKFVIEFSSFCLYSMKNGHRCSSGLELI